MSEFRIRPFKAADEAAVIRLWQRCALIVPWNNPVADIARKCADTPDLFFVGVDNKKVIASCMAGYDGHRGSIYYLAVSPEWRHRGFARRLLQHAEDKLRALGCPKINLMVRDRNHEVIEFYHRLEYADDPVVVISKRLREDDQHDLV